VTKWQWYWAAWLVLGFLVPETWALFTNVENTLSDTAWKWFGVVKGQPITEWNVAHYALAAFLIWLLFHIAWGIWR
jgi:hypothetical protein